MARIEFFQPFSAPSKCSELTVDGVQESLCLSITNRDLHAVVIELAHVVTAINVFVDVTFTS